MWGKSSLISSATTRAPLTKVAHLESHHGHCSNGYYDLDRLADHLAASAVRAFSNGVALLMCTQNGPISDGDSQSSSTLAATYQTGEKTTYHFHFHCVNDGYVH